MRVVIALSVALLSVAPALPGLAATAAASSIERIGGGERPTPSVTIVTCADCPAEAKAAEPTKALPQVQAEALPEGTQRIELRDTNGRKQLLRTEAWLGGSPVTFVNKADGWLDHGDQLVGLAGDGVDPAATTAAVDKPVPLDGNSLQLRLK